MKRQLGWLIACGGLMAAAACMETAPAAGPVKFESGRTLATATTIKGVGNFAKVSETLYRGEQPTAEGVAELKKMGIKTVVNLRDFHTDYFLLRGTGLRHVHIPCAAWDPREEDVVKFLKVVSDPENQPVFVHCMQGADRTGMMVLAYRVTVEGWKVEEAEKELGNFGFHPVWRDITKYVKGFDAGRVRAKMEASKPVKVEVVK